MSDLTKHRSHNPWTIGFPFLWVPRTPSGLPLRERRSWLTALRCRMRRKAIDKELAAGVDPDSTECRHRRASELTGRRNRQAPGDGDSALHVKDDDVSLADEVRSTLAPL